MTHAQILRIKKLTSKGIIEVAARHNHREILAELGAARGGNIDPARVCLNRVLRGHGTAAAVASQAQTLMEAAGIKALRKDAVRALEIIFSMPHQSLIDHDHFFNEAVQWAGQYFAATVISAIIHNDEAAPHCHVLLLPLVNGRMIGSDLMGGRAKLQAMQADFHAQVGQRHGLTRQTCKKHHSPAVRRAAAQIALDVLRANGELSATSDAVMNELLELIAANPVNLLTLMGRTMPTPAIVKGGFAKIMTKPCKPEKPVGFIKKKPIGFDGSAAPANEQTLSCVGVGFANPAPSFPPPGKQQTSAITTTPQQSTMTASAADTEPLHVNLPAPDDSDVTDEPSDQFTRERDSDRRADEWNPDTGEFVTIKPTSRTTHKALATASVRAALDIIGKASRPPQRPPTRP